MANPDKRKERVMKGGMADEIAAVQWPQGGAAVGAVAPEERNLAEATALMQESGPAPDLEAIAPGESEGLRQEQRRESRLAWILLVVGLAGLTALIAVTVSSEKRTREFWCFLHGEIIQCKNERIEQIRKDWSNEDSATKPQYGDVVLTYYPQDARVDITQTICRSKRDLQTGKFGEPDCSAKKEIPNKSHELKQYEIVEQLPMLNMPIREREVKEDADGVPHVTELQTYSYHITIAKEGYQPREFTFAPENWQKLGPEVNHTIPWDGCDLLPKPETMREPFIKARTELFCIEKSVKDAAAGKKLMEDSMPEVVVRARFRTVKDFLAIQNELTADAAWWTPAWDEIQKADCKKILEATKP